MLNKACRPCKIHMACRHLLHCCFPCCQRLKLLYKTALCGWCLCSLSRQEKTQLSANGEKKTVLGKEAAQFGRITYLQFYLLRLVGHWGQCKMAQLVVTTPIWHLLEGCPWPKEADSCCSGSNELAHQAQSDPKQHKAAYDPDATIPGSPMSFLW